MKAISISAAPAALGPYSQGTAAGGLVFVSGQLPVDPATGEIPGNAVAQAERAFANLRAVLAAAGLGTEHVAKTTVFLADLADFAAVNDVYARTFSAPFPARSCIQAAALPRGVRLEVEAIAVRPASGPRAGLDRPATMDPGTMNESLPSATTGAPPGAAAKLDSLRASLRGIGSAVVAFSAGVDSTFLLRVAHGELGDRCVAATVRAPFVPARELAEAVAFCRGEGVEHVVLDAVLGDIPHFAENPPDRCYHCKKHLFTRLVALARARGFAAVLEGTNLDDDGDRRPGRRAIRELGVASPLHEAGFTKADIRALSRAMGLPTADKPSAACLASRIPYGERITAEGLERVGRAEEWIRAAFPGLGQLRVRCHGGTLARIEVLPGDIPAVSARLRDIASALRGIGFARVELDPRGYRTGSLDETLPPAIPSP